MTSAARAALRRLALDAGQAIRDERLRRRWSMADLAVRAGVAIGVVHRVEAGDTASLESYARLGAALGMRPTLEFADSRARRSSPGGEDFVHAAMGEYEARSLARAGVRISIDEPYQHYQFAGRADVLALGRREPAPHREPDALPQPAGGRRLVQRQATVPRAVDGTTTRRGSARLAERHPCDGLPVVERGDPCAAPSSRVLHGAVPGPGRRLGRVDGRRSPCSTRRDEHARADRSGGAGWHADTVDGRSRGDRAGQAEVSRLCRRRRRPATRPMMPLSRDGARGRRCRR